MKRADELLLHSRVAAKTAGLAKTLKNAVQVNVPDGAAEKLNASLNEAVASAFNTSGITVLVNKPALDDAAQQINQALAAEVRDVASFEQCAKPQLKTGVNGVECMLICGFACAAGWGVASAPASAAAWVGGCVAVCALTEGIAALIAGAA